MKVVVIGGGPAGMMSAVSAARSGNEVVILEKMNTLGRKLLITGKGRCNITSSLDMSEFIQNVPGNGRFLYSCFERFTNKDIIELMEKHGVKVKEERGNRIFPVSDKSMDVLNAFLEELIALSINTLSGDEFASWLLFDFLTKLYRIKLLSVPQNDISYSAPEGATCENFVVFSSGESFPPFRYLVSGSSWSSELI